MASAGAAAGAAVATTQRNFGLKHKAHIADVDLHAANTFQQGLFDAESEPVNFKGLIVFSRLIQSQCKTRTASAAGGKIDTDAGLGLVGEESLKLLTSSVGKMNHRFLHRLFSVK